MLRGQQQGFADLILHWLRQPLLVPVEDVLEGHGDELRLVDVETLARHDRFLDELWEVAVVFAAGFAVLGGQGGFQDIQGPLELGFVLGIHQHRGVFDTPAHQTLFRLGASPDEHPALRIELHVLVVRALPDESDFFLGEISRRVRSRSPVRVEVAMLRRGFR